MGNLFHPDSRLIRILSAAASFVALNLLWLLCSVPLVTIGPAAAAMYTVTRKMARREYPSVVPEFFRAFRLNFRQALLGELVLLFPAALALAYLFLSLSDAAGSVSWFRPLCYVAAGIISVVWSYVWPITAWFENSLGQTLRNAVLLPLNNPVIALIVTGLNLLPAFLLLRDAEGFLRVSFFWLAAGGSLTAFVNTQLLRFQLRRFLPEDEFVLPARGSRRKDGEDEGE